MNKTNFKTVGQHRKLPENGFAIKLPEDIALNRRTVQVGYNEKKNRWVVNEYFNDKGKLCFNLSERSMKHACPVFLQDVKEYNNVKVGRVFVSTKPGSFVPFLAKDRKGRSEVSYRYELYEKWVKALNEYELAKQDGEEMKQKGLEDPELEKKVTRLDKELSQCVDNLTTRLNHNVKETDYEFDENWIDPKLEAMYDQKPTTRSQRQAKVQQQATKVAGYDGKQVVFIVMAMLVFVVAYFMMMGNKMATSI